MGVEIRRLDLGCRRALEGDEGSGQRDPDVGRFGEHLRGLGEVVEESELLLEDGHRLAVRRARDGFVAGLTKILHRAIPEIPAERVVREPLDVLA